jgi:chromosomal replication initiator protein
METSPSAAPETVSPRPADTATLETLLSSFSRRWGADRYEIWFRNAARATLAGGVLDVAVPNAFIGRFLEERCAELLRACAGEAVGGPVEVRFRVDPAAFPGRAGADPSAPAPIPRSAPPPPRPRAARRWLNVPAAQTRRFSLADFVVGAGNRMAHAAALRIVEKPGAAFNPLFIHGKVGLGKTHLLLGIASALAGRRPDLEAVYTSAEEFTNVFLAAMKAGDLERFRREMRSLDVLILDDVHFLSRKHATQEEFLHTFNSIEAEGRQIVLASDSPPQELAEFSTRLVNRFVQGMVTCIEPPDFATRRSILAGKAARLNRTLPAEVLDYLADVAPANVRELEGMLTRLLAHVEIERRSADLRTAVELFASRAAAGPAGPSMVARIEGAVAEVFGVAVSELTGTRRGGGLNLARQMLMYLLRERTNWTLQQIADHLHRKNHTTVLIGHRKMQQSLDADEPVPAAGGPRGARPGARSVLARLDEILDGKAAPARGRTGP